MKTTLLLFCCCLLLSCKETNEPADGLAFYFENPQPVDDSELKKIPARFIGTYQDNDSGLLKVEQKIIYSERFFVASVHQSEMDSAMALFDKKDGKLIERETGDVWESKAKGDSIEFRSTWRDTLFYFSENQKAKKINGKLVLNFKKDSLWKIKVVSLDDKNLQIKSLGLPTDLIQSDSITKLKSRAIDSSAYVLQPSRKEFNTILKIKELGYGSTYKKIQ